MIEVLPYTPVYVIYSFKDGIQFLLGAFPFVVIFAILNALVSYYIGGLRRKDCFAVFITSFMMKSILLTFTHFNNLRHSPYSLIGYWHFIIAFLISIVVEGFIYKKVLKSKKHSGFTVSIVCNIGAVGFIAFCLFCGELILKIR